MKKISSLFFVLAFFWISAVFSLEPIIVLYGPPGSGKGTFSQYLTEQYDYEHVSSGDLVRSEIDRKTPLGRDIEEIVKRGDFIDQEIMHSLMRQKITEFVQNNKPFIVDGFARSEKGIRFLNDTLQEFGLLDRVLLVYLKASDETCANRILTRMVCPQCSHVYNMTSAPPLQEGICDICGASLKIRLNDERVVIMKRLAHYRNTIEPLVSASKLDFPYVCFDTQIPLEECLKNYTLFISQFE